MVDLVRFSNKIISPEKVTSPTDKARYVFYTRAAAIIRGSNDTQPGAINEINSGDLTERDAHLLRASQSLVKAILDRPSLKTSQTMDEEGKPLQATDQKAPMQEVVSQGRQVIASIDKLLEE